MGGDGGEAWWLNDVGHVVGRADVAGSATHHAFLWKHEHMKDLGTPHGNPCSTAEGINSYDQVVGDSGECEVGGDPFLWENGGPVVALSDFTLPGSDLTATSATNITRTRRNPFILLASPTGFEPVLPP